MRVNKIVLWTLAMPVLLLAQSFPMRWSPRDIDVNFEAAKSVYATDLDNDGDNDVLGAASELNEITWWENDGNGNFTKQIITNTFGGAYCVRAQDLNNDGNNDVLGIAFDAAIIAWWKNDGASPPHFTECYLIADNFCGGVYVEAIDLDNDNDIDVLATGVNDQSPTWWENTGTGSFNEHQIQRSGGILDFSIGDLDGDGDIDIVGTSYDDDAVFWFENDGDAPPHFTEHFLSAVYGLDPYPIYVDDLDSDGDVDIVLGYGQKLVWMERRSDVISHDGRLIFDHHTICYQMQLTATSIYVTDLDDDQDKDILVTAASVCKDGRNRGVNEENIIWWENDGNENFAGHIIARNYYGARSAFAAHIDDDRWKDVLAVSNVLGHITWWKNNPVSVHKPILRSSTEEESNNTPTIVLTSAPIHKRGTVNFTLTLNRATYVDLSIYDALGRKAETIVSQSLTPGTYNISNQRVISAGIYFLKLKTDAHEYITRKFLVTQ